MSGKAKKAREWMSENHPDYTFGDVDYRPVSKSVPDLETGYREIMRMLENDDPRVSTIMEAYDNLLEQKGYDFQGFKRHFEFKRKEAMGGFEGAKEWLSPEQNAREGFQASIKYAEQALTWAEVAKANNKLKEVIKDPDIQASQKNALAYSQLYWDRAMGKSGELSRAIDRVVDIAGDITGLGRSNLVGANRWLKGAITLKLLGFYNTMFLGSQVYQPMAMIPHWLTYLSQQGAKANPLISGWKAEMDLHLPRAQMSDVGRKAFDWGTANHLFDSYIIDDIRTVTSKPWVDALDAVVKLAPTKIEGYTRAMAYLNFFHHMHDSGVSPKVAYETAAKLTDMSMTNYKMHERPLVYRELGAAGDMASALTTFKHNQYYQLLSMGKSGRRINLVPMIGAQLVAGGLLGFYAREDVDSLIKTLNAATAYFNVDVPYMPTLRETLLKHTPDWVMFGGVSKVTGADMSSRFSAADIVPSGVGDAFFPLFGEVSNLASAAVDVLAHRSGESVVKLAHTAAPTSMKVIPEAMNVKDGMAISPQTDLGQRRRTTGDWVARGLGGYSIGESRERQSAQEARNENQWSKTVQQNILKQATSSDDRATLQKLATRYVTNGGNIDDFVAAIKSHKMGQLFTPLEREAGYPLPNTLSPSQAFKYNRAKEYMGK